MGDKERHILEYGEQRHLGCPNVKKGIMRKLKDTDRGQLWFCGSCRNVVTTILFPSYEDYMEQDKERKKRLRRYGKG
jgi:hypothetical protein